MTAATVGFLIAQHSLYKDLISVFCGTKYILAPGFDYINLTTVSKSLVAKSPGGFPDVSLVSQGCLPAHVKTAGEIEVTHPAYWEGGTSSPPIGFWQPAHYSLLIWV